MRLFCRVIVVGGDGFANECIHGLALRALADANKDARDLDLHLITPPVPIGIIPAGIFNIDIEHMTQ